MGIENNRAKDKSYLIETKKANVFNIFKKHCLVLKEQQLSGANKLLLNVKYHRSIVLHFPKLDNKPIVLTGKYDLT